MFILRCKVDAGDSTCAKFAHRKQMLLTNSAENFSPSKSSWAFRPSNIRRVNDLLKPRKGSNLEARNLKALRFMISAQIYHRLQEQSERALFQKRPLHKNQQTSRVCEKSQCGDLVITWPKFHASIFGANKVQSFSSKIHEIQGCFALAFYRFRCISRIFWISHTSEYRSDWCCS